MSQFLGSNLERLTAYGIDPRAVAILREEIARLRQDPSPLGTLTLITDTGRSTRQTKLSLDSNADAQMDGRMLGAVKWAIVKGAVTTTTDPTSGNVVYFVKCRACRDYKGRFEAGAQFDVLVTGDSVSVGDVLPYGYDASGLAISSVDHSVTIPTIPPATTVSWAKVTGNYTASTGSPSIFSVPAVRASDKSATTTTAGAITIVLPLAPDALDGFIPSTAPGLFPQAGAVIPYIDDSSGTHVSLESRESGHTIGVIRWAKCTGNLTYSPTTAPGTAAGTVYSVNAQACSGVSGNDAQGGNFPIIIPVDPALYAVLLANSYTFFLPQNGRTITYQFDASGNRIASHGV